MKPMQEALRIRSTGAKPASQPGRLGSVARGLAGAGLGVVMRNPGITLSAVVIAGVAGLVSWNALQQQSGRHPAPLFASKPETRAVEPPRRPEVAAIPVPVPRPEPLQTAAIPKPDATARPGQGSDGIGALLRSSESARTPEGGKTDATRVASAQKALTKLGYGPLKVDGVMGTGTRQAIERFEREKSLPVSGSLSPRTVRKLATLSGVAVD